MTVASDVQIALLVERQKAMDEELAEARSAIRALQDERNRALKWGIMALGSAVMGMAFWIFNAITGGHLK